MIPFDHTYPTGQAGHVLFLMGDALGNRQARATAYGYGFSADDSEGVFPDGATVEEVCGALSDSFVHLMGYPFASARVDRYGFADGTAILVNLDSNWFQQENPERGFGIWDFDPIANEYQVAP
mgnify:CR=1 FL=1